MVEPFENRNLSAAQRVRMQLAYGKYELVSNNILNLLDEMDKLELEVELLEGELAKFWLCSNCSEDLGHVEGDPEYQTYHKRA